MKMPRKPTGNTPRVSYDREMWDFIRSLTPLPGVGIKFTTTSSGTIYNADKREGGGGGVQGQQSYLAWFEDTNKVGDTSITYEEDVGAAIVRGIDQLYFDGAFIYLNNKEITQADDTTVIIESKIYFFSEDEERSFQIYFNEANNSIFIEKRPKNPLHPTPDDTGATGLQYFLPIIVEPSTVINELDHTHSGLVFTQFDLLPLVFNLPLTPVVGCFYQFALRFNERMTVQSRDNQKILWGGTSSSLAGYITSETGGDFLDLFYLGTDTVGPGGIQLWMVRIANGGWTLG